MAQVSLACSASCASPSNLTLNVSFTSVFLIYHVACLLFYLPPPIRPLTRRMLMHASISISWTPYIAERVLISLNPDFSCTLLSVPSSTHQLEAYSSLRLAHRELSQQHS